MAFFSPAPLPSFTNVPRNILHLPTELILRIFLDLLLETGSSASLVPCLFTCATFYNILIGEPVLWTRLCANIDTVNLSPDRRNIRSYWPRLHVALRLSQTLPFSFVIDLDTDHPDLTRIAPEHLYALTFAILESDQAFMRCQELIIRSSEWQNMCDIMEPLTSAISVFPVLERIELLFVPPLPTPNKHPAGDRYFLSLLDADAAENDVVLADELKEYSEQNLPNLREVVLHAIPFDWQTFSPAQLISLQVLNIPGPEFQPSCGELKQVLLLNSTTLTRLTLGTWAVAAIRVGMVQQRYTLPVLTELRFTIKNYLDFVGLVETLNVPNLKRLAIKDDCHRFHCLEKAVEVGEFTPAAANQLRRISLDGYAVMMNYWPLEQVTDLDLCCVIFYEMDGNLISLLRPSYDKEETWEGGLPLATRFFYKFSSLVSLELWKVDATTLEAINFPPRRYNASTGLFDDILPVFPLLPSRLQMT
ncbi:hypothetical protein E1B28_009588 [Marasmius oreades]|uniref:F-box domain-containing protein n=1 Tax=Marasmius oreades TaxID=181124 RepID=A0A9P7RVC9_9AGAR|nr:uncharacterized protein E1B28_009588 [Marasmius oreades]KAG7090474.1 hypothetical protein E1B28_009588 [Marasmius oreades]